MVAVDELESLSVQSNDAADFQKTYTVSTGVVVVVVVVVG